MPVKKKSSKKKPTLARTKRRMMATAQKCRIVTELSDEEMAALAKQYCSLDPAEVTELTFTLKRRRVTSKSEDVENSWAGDTF